MADSGNKARLYADDILYNVWRNNIGLNIANQGWRAYADKLGFDIPMLESNAGADRPADRDALETGPTLDSADLTGIQINHTPVRGWGQINKRDEKISGGGPQLQMQVNAEVAQVVSQEVDDYIFEAIVRDANYSANDNSFKLGDATDFVSRGTGEPSTDAAAELPGKVLNRIHRAMTRDNVLGADSTGNGANTRGTAVLPVELSAIAVDDLSDKGVLQTRGDIGADALIERGIVGVTPYEGRAYGFDIVYSNALEVPASGDWEFYVIPNGSVLFCLLYTSPSPRDS